MIDDIRDKIKDTDKWLENTRNVLDEIDTELDLAILNIEGAKLSGSEIIEGYLILAMAHVMKAKNMAEDI